MKKLLGIVVLCLLFSGSAYALEILYKNRYFEIPYDKKKDNCGSHLAVGKAAQYILKRRDLTKDFRGKSLIINEHKLIKSDKKLSIFRYSDFDSPLFDKDFKLIYSSDYFYVFAQEFDNFPDDEFFKNIIFFTINREDLIIDMGTVYIKSKNILNKFNSLNFKQFDKIDYGVGEDIVNEMGSIINDQENYDGSWSQYTPLAGCIIVEVDYKKPKPKI